MSDTVVRVLVVDDSALMRKLLGELIESDPGLTVCGLARNGLEAVEKVIELQPDVVTMDVEMPVLDGLGAIDQIMIKQPTPVLVVSSLTTEAAAASFDALDRGAVDCLPKPSNIAVGGIEAQKREILERIRGAAGAQPRSSTEEPPGDGLGRGRGAHTDRVKEGTAPAVVAIGASTGGPRTMCEILPHLPPDLPAAVLIVQHLPDAFVESFASRLRACSPMPVVVPHHQTPLCQGVIYVAPGGRHLRVAPSGLGTHSLVLDPTPCGRKLIPSVGELFSSLETDYDGQIVAVLLTGMGDDGAQEMLRLRRAGAETIAEEESSCIVYGMPRVAIELGAAGHIVRSPWIARRIVEQIRKNQ